jgi:hypothetical protein
VKTDRHHQNIENNPMQSSRRKAVRDKHTSAWSEAFC